MQFMVGTNKDVVGQKILTWFTEKQGYETKIEYPFSTICWFEDNLPVAAVVFNGYNGSSIEGHMYAPKHITRCLIAQAYAYAFKQMNCNVMIARIPRNSALKNLLPRAGFKYIALIPSYFSEGKKGDAIMYVLKKETAIKWIR